MKRPVETLNGASEADHRARRHALARALMLITSICWAGNIVAGKIALRGVSPAALAQFRVTASAAAFAVFGLCRGRTLPRGLRLTEWGSLAVAAIFGVTLNQLCFVGGIGRTSAAHAGLIVGLGPVMVLVLASAMRLEEFTLAKGIGTAVALTGVAVLTLGKRASSNGATVSGDSIMFAGTTVFAYYTVLLKKLATRYDGITLNAVIFGLGAIFLVPFSLTQVRSLPWHALPREAWWAMAFMVLLGTFISYLIYVFALAELTAARVAAFAYLQPIVAIILAILLLAEKLTSQVTLGGLLILCGVYLAEREAGAERDTPDVSTN
jgi:drug/metabolite transporter (DMT)-like permease